MKSCLTFCRGCFSSFSTPTKFDPLLHQIISGAHLRAMNRRNVIKKLSTVISIESSKCAAIVARQVNKTPYLFICLLFDVLVHLYCLIVSGPKQSTPVIVKGGLNTPILSFGKFRISCGFGIERSCLHNEHVDKTLRIMDLALTTQYLSLSKASV